MRVILVENYGDSYIDSSGAQLISYIDFPTEALTYLGTQEGSTNFLASYSMGNRGSDSYTMLVYGDKETIPLTAQNVLNGTYGNVNYYATEMYYRVNDSDVSTVSDFRLDLNSLLNPSATSNFWSLPGNDYIYGGGNRDFLDGKAGSDQLFGRGGSDVFYDTDFFNSDYFYGGEGNDHLDFLTQSKSDWTVGVATRTDLAAGTHYLHNPTFGNYEYINSVETVHFSDGKLRFDIDPGEEPGQAYRLYQAAFARTPDMPGVRYHVNDMESNGLSLWNVANNFIASPEFKNMYGENPTDEEYINALYRNVLNRSASDDEVSWYQDQFNTGAMDRAAALIGFAESPENVSLVAPDLLNGVWLPDPI